MIKKKQVGFSLLELAIVIVILAAILGSVLVPMATQVQVKKIKETGQLLEDVKEALIGFALSNGRLPCPDDPATGGITGTEDRPLGPPLGACNALEGFLPWNILGASPTDAWGRLWHYSVVGEFTFPFVGPPATCPAGVPNQLELCDAGNIDVRDRAGIFLVGGTAPGTPGAPAVVVSTGPNGLGGRDFLSGATLPNPPPGATDELDNLITTPSNRRFVSRSYFDDAPAGCVDPGCNFDDLVVWLSTPILFNRMVAAGRLP